jgi:ABC-type uncharacterized transport system substrate-binding protein
LASVDYYEVGHDAGAIAARVLKEEAPGDIPVMAAMPLSLSARLSCAISQNGNVVMLRGEP